MLAGQTGFSINGYNFHKINYTYDFILMTDSERKFKYLLYIAVRKSNKVYYLSEKRIVTFSHTLFLTRHTNPMSDMILLKIIMPFKRKY